MRLTQIEIAGFKSFAKKSSLSFSAPVTAVVGPNGSGKSNVVEAFRFVLGEQSMKSMRGKVGADLLFRGGPTATKVSRAAVSITFDNKDKIFGFQTAEGKSPVLFESITFTRELFADGTSKYSMNGTEIKLKQMLELLSSVNIGSSSHHIISQGEADSVLRANARERRGILEDALGLKVYHYRIKETESKLAKTTETLKEVHALRRELAPHLTFLKKQVEKVEKAHSIRTELSDALVRYLATERAALEADDRKLRDAIELIETKKQSEQAKLQALPEDDAADAYGEKIAAARTDIAALSRERRELETKMSRLQGMIEAHRRMSQPVQQQPASQSITFAETEYSQLLTDLQYFINGMKTAQTLEATREFLSRIEGIVATLKAKQAVPPQQQSQAPAAYDIRDTVLEVEQYERQLHALLSKEEAVTHALIQLETARDADARNIAAATRERYEIRSAIQTCESELQVLAVRKGSFTERKEYFDTELKEAAFLFGPTFMHALKEAQAYPELDLHEVKRSIDRLKIRLDEHSGIGHEVVEEYEQTKEREAFLLREMTDIESSSKNLQSLVVDLKGVLDEKFTKGVAVINERFGEFFKTMFGGGSAFLSVTLEKKRKRKGSEEDEEELEIEEAEEEMERGIDVHVNLPEKKVKELTMLSGGERSLVSIALLFAISQVNPPPFLVLDETDAALDEANSRRYGDMVERLSAYSQLIVVTHNRETMSRATVLYGVTLGSDGGSKLLSIKFDEAVKVAK